MNAFHGSPIERSHGSHGTFIEDLPRHRHGAPRHRAPGPAPRRLPRGRRSLRVGGRRGAAAARAARTAEAAGGGDLLGA